MELQVLSLGPWNKLRMETMDKGPGSSTQLGAGEKVIPHLPALSGRESQDLSLVERTSSVSSSCVF